LEDVIGAGTCPTGEDISNRWIRSIALIVCIDDDSEQRADAGILGVGDDPVSEEELVG